MVKQIVTYVALLLLLFPAIFVEGSTSTSAQKVDEFKDINCEEEMARLDNFTINLQNTPTSKGVIIFHGGRRLGGRLPRRGDAAARAARLKSYLTQRRGIPKEQIIVIDGGYREEWMAELWIVPLGADLPVGSPTIPTKAIKFRKGKARARDFRCEI